MKEILRSFDKVKLNWARALLKDAGIESYVMDENTGDLLTGVSYVAPRLMVSDEDFEDAINIIEDFETEYE